MFAKMLVRCPASAMLVAVTQLALAAESQAQGTTWRYDAGGFSVTFPAGWSRAGTEGVRQYSPTARTAMSGSFHSRRAGGIVRRRYLAAQVYSFGAVPEGGSAQVLAQAVLARIASSYQVVDRYEVPGRDLHLTAYRFQHSGDPVSQAAIVFAAAGDMFMIEVTGHRSDERLLLAEARQIAHSVEVAATETDDLLAQVAAYFEVSDSAMHRIAALRIEVKEQFLSGGRMVIPADFMGSTSMDYCRAAAVTLWAGATSRMIQRPSPTDFEVRVNCRESSVIVETILGARSILRQFDSSGAIVFEKATPSGN